MILYLGLGLERYQAQYPIPNTLASDDTNTKYRYRKWRHLLKQKYVSTTGEYKVAFSLRPLTTVACPQSNVCEHGDGLKFSIEGVLPTTVDRGNTHGRNARRS